MMAVNDPVSQVYTIQELDYCTYVGESVTLCVIFETGKCSDSDTVDVTCEH